MDLLRLVGREFIVNYKFIVGRIPFLLLIAMVLVLRLSSSSSQSLLVVAGVAINILVGVIAFIQIFLSAHKNNDLKFLLVLQVDKKHIVDSKMLFITLLSILYNIPVVFPLAFTNVSSLVVCNVFILDVLISSLIGSAMLLLYIRSNFESFLTRSQYLRWAIVLSFMLVASMFHGAASEIVLALQFSPLFAFLCFGVLWYSANYLNRILLLDRNVPF